MGPRQPLAVQTLIPRVLRNHAAHATADCDARAVLPRIVQMQTRLLPGLVGGDDSELREPIQHFTFGVVEVEARIEARNFRGHLREIAGWVEMGDAADAALTG